MKRGLSNKMVGKAGRRLMIPLTAGVILAAAALEIVKKQSHTNLTGQESYMEQLQVAGIEHLFQAGRQKVYIQEIYKGEGVKEREEVYLFSDHWRLSLTGEPDSVERGFVNVMEVGTEYLVFITGQVQGLDVAAPAFKLYDDFLIAPVFCYEDRDNVIVPTGKETTYVSYKDVRNNEFFAETEEALQVWEELKEKMISAYGRTSKG